MALFEKSRCNKGDSKGEREGTFLLEAKLKKFSFKQCSFKSTL